MDEMSPPLWSWGQFSIPTIKYCNLSLLKFNESPRHFTGSGDQCRVCKGQFLAPEGPPRLKKAQSGPERGPSKINWGKTTSFHFWEGPTRAAGPSMADFTPRRQSSSCAAAGFHSAAKAAWHIGFEWQRKVMSFMGSGHWHLWRAHFCLIHAATSPPRLTTDRRHISADPSDRMAYVGILIYQRLVSAETSSKQFRRTNQSREFPRQPWFVHGSENNSISIRNSVTFVILYDKAGRLGEPAGSFLGISF